MSFHITEAEIRKFDPDVKGIYQANARLGFFHRNNAAGASSYQINRFGTGIGSQSIPGAVIPNMNSAVEKKTIFLERWDHAEYINDFQKMEVPWDAVGMAAKCVCAPSCGRRDDQVIINNMNTIPNTYDIPWNYGGAVEGITTRMVNRANSILSWHAVPVSERYFIAPYMALEMMLDQKEFISRNYISDLTPALNGEIVTFSGFRWIFIANNPEGGLPYEDQPDGSRIYNCFACHKSAVEV